MENQSCESRVFSQDAHNTAVLSGESAVQLAQFKHRNIFLTMCNKVHLKIRRKRRILQLVLRSHLSDKVMISFSESGHISAGALLPGALRWTIIERQHFGYSDGRAVLSHNKFRQSTLCLQNMKGLALRTCWADHSASGRVNAAIYRVSLSSMQSGLNL